MPERVGRAWRLAATGLSFLVFGVGGLAMWVIGLPLLYLLYRRPQRRRAATRRLVQRAFWLYVRFMRALGVLRFQTAGAARLQRPGLLIVANHPTLLDVVFLLSMVPDALCIVRAGLWSNPFTRGAVRAAGYLCNDLGAALVDTCARALHEGSSVIVFPQGTRLRAGVAESRKWHRGAAHIALRAGVPLTPVSIGCEPLLLRKGEPWWHVPPRIPHYSIRILDDLPTAYGRAAGEGDVRAARGLTRQLQELLAAE